MAPLLIAGVLVLAASTRLSALLASGLQSFGRYDDGVHFAAALGLVHGLLPYRDLLLLQPPGLVVLLAPSALLGSWLGDGDAFVLARLGFVLFGVLNTGLVCAVLRRSTPGSVPLLCGGLLYAVSPAAVYVEQTTLLEVPGTTAVLGALLLLLRSSGSPRSGLIAAIAGLVAGLGIGVKIWYIVPALVLLAGARGRRSAFFAGATVGVLAVYLPFFLLAPQLMWQQVVAAQLGRPRSNVGAEERVASMLGLDGAQLGLAAVLLVVLVALGALSLFGGGTGLHLALAVSTGAVLLAGPSFFQHYTALTAAPMALVAGAGVGRAVPLIGGSRAAIAAVLATAVVALAVDVPHLSAAPSGKALPVVALRAAADRISGCVVADDPTVLILIDRFGPDVAHGCLEQADLTGRAYVDLPPGASSMLPRQRNPVFQQEAVEYLRSGAGYLLARGRGLGLARASLDLIEHDRGSTTRSASDGLRGSISAGVGRSSRGGSSRPPGSCWTVANRPRT